MENVMTVAGKLRGRRAERGINQRDLAREVGISKSTISRLENGEAVMKIEHAWALADYYGCSIDELIGRKQEA